ncbi:13068_t:CDS:2, partial [Gigaspora rosea]
ILDTETEKEPCGDLEKWSQPKLYDTKTQDNENDEVDASQIVEQGLMQELSQNTPGFEINKSYIQKFDNLVPGSAQSLSYLFNKARAQKILKMFGGGVGIAKIKQVAYSASTISELTNVQIQNIIDHEDLLESKKTLSEKQNNPVHTHANFRNKTLEQYPDIFYKFNNENIDYYRITDRASCPLCKLDYDDEKGIEGRYASSYYIKYK